MAGGIDWFRWHHGTVTDQKFLLVARRAGASVAEVIAVWACVLESASMSSERGSLSQDPDFEAMDCALGLVDGRAAAIFSAMRARSMIDEHLQVSAWLKRQPKRERDDDCSTERSKAFRAKQRHATPSDATERTETPREEKRREEEKEERAAVSPPPPTRAHEADPAEEAGQQPTAAGAICRAMRQQARLAGGNPGDPRFLALIAQGATEAEFVGIAAEAVSKGKGWAWVLAVLQARRTEAAGITLAQPPPDPMAWRQTSEGVFAMAKELGMQIRPNELFHDLERRVVMAFRRARSAQESTA